MKTKSEITRLLIEIRNDSEEAYNKLFPLVYDELKQLAHSKLKHERNDITISETALVHEVYLRLIESKSVDAKDKNHFMAIAARCMRQILVDHARKKRAQKRGGEKDDVTYVDELLKVNREADNLIDLDEKINELSKLDERMADIVVLRFFGQMTIANTADALDVSKRTVKRDWAKARGWLYKNLKKNRN